MTAQVNEEIRGMTKKRVAALQLFESSRHVKNNLIVL